MCSPQRLRSPAVQSLPNRNLPRKLPNLLQRNLRKSWPPTASLRREPTASLPKAEELKPDGTYIQTDADGTVVETGRWVQKSPQDYCWTVDEQYREEDDTGAEKCNTEAVSADGVWTSTNADGETATVERM